MSPVLETRVIRDFLHGLVDGFVNELEGKAELLARPTVRTAEPAPARRVKPATPPKIQIAKRRKPTTSPRPEVTMSCCQSSANLRVAIHLSAAVASRLGLKKGGHAKVQFPRAGSMTISSGTSGIGILNYGGERLTIQMLARSFGIAEKHKAEGAVHHFGLQDELIIALPSWWPTAAPKAPVVVSPPQMRSKKDNSKDEQATCTDLSAHLGSHVLCVACTLKPASLECNLCQKLICLGCWDSHVRTHWHAGHKGKASSARQHARHAMGSEA